MTDLKVVWSQDAGYDDLGRKSALHGLAAEHFRAELARVVDRGRRDQGAARHLVHGAARHDRADRARHRRQGDARVALLPVLHPPVGRPTRTSTRTSDPHITGDQARAIDSAIDQYNETIEAVVAHGAPATSARTGTCSTSPGCSTGSPRAATSTTRTRGRPGGRRTRCRPRWPRCSRRWTRASSPATATAVGRPAGCSRSTACTRRRSPTGSIAQELINIMRLAGVAFRQPERRAAHGPRDRGLRPAAAAGHPRQSSAAEHLIDAADTRLGGRGIDLTTHALHFSGS